ncbi:MAG TPA: hypothetical protein VMR97_12180 [Acidimicrobiales bacterium]|nr:hypothetical protein [Acidimicrobiales bacterium]
MIKRITFCTRGAAVATDVFETSWRQLAAVGLTAPEAARPLRVAVGTALPDICEDRPHDGVRLEWFADEHHFGRFESWTSSTEGSVEASDDAVKACTAILAEELVLRGHDWVTEYWRRPRTVYMHMAVARRAKGLSPGDFSARWKGRAGVVHGPGEARTPIPAAVRGLAYVQNHPRPLEAGEWAYDAVNEVYFEDRQGLRTRVEWFAEHLGDAPDGDLIGEHGFVAIRQEVLGPGS